MRMGSSSKSGVEFGEYGDAREPEESTIGSAPKGANEPNRNKVIGWVEPACDNPSWIIWFTQQGDALVYSKREPGGGVIGEPLKLRARE